MEMNENEQQNLEENQQEQQENSEQNDNNGDVLDKSATDNLSEIEKNLQAKQLELWQKEVGLELKTVGLEQFAEFIVADNADQLKDKIGKFQKLLNDLKVSNAFVPNEHKQEDSYSKFEKNKDTKNMIGTKLANLFK
jgi:molecular chaperone GrpE